MSVMVDQQPLAAEELGLQTVGQVLAHLQRDDRLIVNLLIDGQKPDLSKIGQIRQSAVQGKTLFIETAHPTEMALEVLAGVETQLIGAERFKGEAAELLGQNQVAKAMEKLGLCFTTWKSAQESVMKIGQLLRLDLEKLTIGKNSLGEVLAEFAEQLRQIKQALSDRDFVLLSDVLLYETTETNRRWGAVLGALRGVVGNFGA